MSKVLNENVTKNYPIDPVYVFTQENTTATLVNVQGAPYQSKVQVGLQYQPLNLYRDRGMLRVFAWPVQPTLPLSNYSVRMPIDYGSQVDAVSAADLENLKNLRFSKPDIGNLKYRREGQTLWIYGLNADTYKMVQFDITYVPRYSLLEDLGDDDVVPMTESLYLDTIKEATQICYDQIYHSGVDLRDDSVQGLQTDNSGVAKDQVNVS